MPVVVYGNVRPSRVRRLARSAASPVGCRGIHGTDGTPEASTCTAHVKRVRLRASAPPVRTPRGLVRSPYGGSGTYVSARCLTQVEEQRAVGLLLLLIEGHWVEPSARWADASGLVRLRLGASLVLHQHLSSERVAACVQHDLVGCALQEKCVRVKRLRGGGKCLLRQLRNQLRETLPQPSN